MASASAAPAAPPAPAAPAAPAASASSALTTMVSPKDPDWNPTTKGKQPPKGKQPLKKRKASDYEEESESDTDDSDSSDSDGDTVPPSMPLTSNKFIQLKIKDAEAVLGASRDEYETAQKNSRTEALNIIDLDQKRRKIEEANEKNANHLRAQQKLFNKLSEVERIQFFTITAKYATNDEDRALLPKNVAKLLTAQTRYHTTKESVKEVKAAYVAAKETSDKATVQLIEAKKQLDTFKQLCEDYYRVADDLQSGTKAKYDAAKTKFHSTTEPNCKICFEKPINALFDPCGCVKACMDCAQHQRIRRTGRCPFCNRSTTRNPRKVFLG